LARVLEVSQVLGVRLHSTSQVEVELSPGQ
jgi:hypothetical protein